MDDQVSGPVAAPGSAVPHPPGPPRHLADLDPAGRRGAARELGQQAFRADQLSRHYFGRLTDDPEQMTDLPAGPAGRAGRRTAAAAAHRASGK